MPTQTNSFATLLIVGPVCFFLGVLFTFLPYDYNVLWSTPLDREPYYVLLENHVKFLHASPPLISRILHIVIGTGFLGFIVKLYKPSEANKLFDGASLVLYMCGITVYIANIIKGFRVVTGGIYGAMELVEGESVAAAGGSPGEEGYIIGREDSLRVLAASNTILALVLIGVLVLQGGQWYAQHQEEAEIAAMNKTRDEKKNAQKKKA
ncbi:hypothetical protein BLS_009908 [Venturia inaequalis]|uniref:Shr3 amino acid permease chaperone n=1 Tax=Venturia inaequalis TaxID=5025 RepID=A0A8H3YKC8_VENIN|nr:hypothetical protein BLS_009908 [Venturia inaequalis]KAE9963336.1 hypothetical protein EG328_011501 [Venturia inaequalis]KAE9968247.1 hypothetical protein EG327_011127 [Venturia inaequalis]RDI79587.1 hypothetical protein Vi05172_g10407 [Venturia inaequalis]